MSSSGASQRVAPRTKAASPSEAPIRIGISTCLLGERVRFDGGHKRDPFLVETFGRYVEWVSVCPEVEAGLGVPRESMRLRRIGDQLRLVTTKTGIDHSDTMRSYAARRVAALRAHELCGHVLKKSFPSCGMERVKIYGLGGPITSGRPTLSGSTLSWGTWWPARRQ